MPPKGIAMIILPAIDIKQAQCVRLYKGDMSTAQRVADDPFSTAAAFKNCSAEWVHMVDLDGAFAGERKNADIFLKIASQSGLKVELGGGIRTMEDVEFYLEFFAYGCPPHGGFGLGVDRLTMLLLGMTIKEAMFIFRGPNRLNP